jgi:hypothetical protein
MHTTALVAGCVAGVTPEDDVWSTCAVMNIASLFTSNSLDFYVGLEELAIPPNVHTLEMESDQQIMVMRDVRVFEI